MRSLNASTQRIQRSSLRCKAAIVAPPDAGKAAQGYARPDKSGRYGQSHDRVARPQFIVLAGAKFHSPLIAHRRFFRWPICSW